MGHTKEVYSRIRKITIYCALVSSVKHTKMSALTLSPTTLLPTRKLTGTQIALYNESFGAPDCQSVGSCSCDLLVMLNGVDGYESFAPNTIDRCHDYSIGTYHANKSIQKIIVRTVSGGSLALGGKSK